MKRVISTAIVAGFCCLGLSAHEQPTHVNLTAAALKYLSSNVRPQLLAHYAALVDGAWNEDAALSPFPLGRYYFHFLPTLNDLGQSADCNSVMWGILGNSCTATTTVPIPGATTVLNAHGWQNAISDADANFAPSDVSWDHLGYVIHLLEDLTSPPHVRDSAHPCIFGFVFCDPFETDNANATVQMPLQQYIDFSDARSPSDFFAKVQSYTHSNYYSYRTVFDGNGGPTAIYEDSQYFYAPCLPVSTDVGTCDSTLHLRRIAYKSFVYQATYNPRSATIDRVIAKEQFQELAPVAVQAVAELIKFYAPAVSITTDGTPGSGVVSSPTGIDCGSTCSSLFVNGTSVLLTATVPAGYVVSWGGDCAGTNETVIVSQITKDTTCSAHFVRLQFTSTTLTCSYASVPNDFVGAIDVTVDVAGTVSAPSGLFSFRAMALA